MALLLSLFEAREFVHAGELNYAAEWSNSRSKQFDELCPYFGIWVNKDTKTQGYGNLGIDIEVQKCG